MNEEAKQWFDQANQDLQTARILAESRRYGPCAFYCQQAAEKALKSVLYSVGERPWGHSVPALLDQICAALEIAEDGVPTAEAAALDEHYMRPRYPDARSESESDYHEEVAQEALEQAQAVLSFAKECMSNAPTDSAR